MMGRVLRWSLYLFTSCLILTSSSVAVAQSVVISEFQTGSSASAAHEYISLHNNADQPFDVSGWCLQYLSASYATTTQLFCFPTVEGVELIILPQQYIRFATTELTSSQPGLVVDYSFKAGLAANGGHLRLMDNDNPKHEVDRVGWGTATQPEGTALAAPPAGKIAERLLVDGIRQDTNNNLADFGVDVCSNIDGVQVAVPIGMGVDQNGDCLNDVCHNIEGLQAEVPQGFILDGDFVCIEALEDSTILITELLPNVSGSDTGKEYIELYNPNDHEVNLKDYKLSLGPSFATQRSLLDAVLLPFTYISFSDTITGITLPNSFASVRLTAPAGNVVSETDQYENPPDDAAWALINDIWQYTMQPTPAAANILLVNTAATTQQNELQPCEEGKFRNPETNRCKTIESSNLVPCAPGQERNPDTNRCRSAVGSADSLTPCREGQERNPETNRCRNIVSAASALAPCAPGQERNPETNRCRKTTGSVQSAATDDVADVPSAASSKQTWIMVAGVTLAALGYALYEWRYELRRLLFKLRPSAVLKS